MNCKQIREAIDTASRHDPRSGYVASHLNGCPDCHRYSDETASLLGLLGAQPRVEAPPDFEFRMRARIARAQDAPAGNPQGFLQKMRAETFSWGQMVAAAAALTLVVTVSTLYININRDNGAPSPGGDVTAAGGIDSRSSGAGPAPEIKPLAVESVGATPVRITSRSIRVRPAPSRSTVSPNEIAGIDGSTRLYSPEAKRLLNDRRRFYGAETASISLAKPVYTALTF